jgi:hypothetical protein
MTAERWLAAAGPVAEDVILAAASYVGFRGFTMKI